MQIIRVTQDPAEAREEMKHDKITGEEKTREEVSYIQWPLLTVFLLSCDSYIPNQNLQ